MFNPVDEEGNPITTEVKDIGNGSKCVALVTSYAHKLSAKHGNSPTIRKLLVTDILTYTPAEAEEEDLVL